MVGDDAQVMLELSRLSSGRRVPQTECNFAASLHQRLKQIRVEIADFALQDGGDAFEARAGVDGRLRQGIELAAGVPIELHED